MTKRIIPFTIAATLLLTASCTKEGIFVHGSSSRIQAVVSASSIKTKVGLSDEDGRFIGSYILAGIGGDSLCIDVYEFDNNEFPQDLFVDTTLQTKGAVVNTDRLNRNGQTFTLNAWLESSNRYTGSSAQLNDGHVYEPADATDYHFMKDATATYNGSAWGLSCVSPVNDNWNIWRNNVPTNFWAMYPESLGSGHGSISMNWPGDKVSDEAQKTLSFDYTLPAPSSDFSDAVNQPDLCFAYSRKAWDESAAGNDDKINVDFNHALSAVYFSTSGVLNSITVKRIGINNVPSTAHCEITGTDGAANGNPGTPEIVWTDQSDLKDYRQAYQNSDFGSSKTIYFDGSDKVFMMIPDTLDASTELWAEFEVKGAAVQKSVNISKFDNGQPVVWKPGMKYLYKLAFKGLDNFTFYFNETGNPNATARSFSNTTESGTVDIPVVSAAVNADNATVNDVDWTIKSVQVGTGAKQAVDAGSFDSIGGVSASRSGSVLTVTAAPRTGIIPGSHDYWTNAAGRTNHLDWSPEDWNGRGVIDLSKYDFQDETTDNPMTTANCYVIRHAGTYKLPLVYGNGIVNGAFNVESYAPTMTAGGQSRFFLPNFKNHLDNDIFSPFIEYNTRNGIPSAHDFITPASCEIVWQDEADIITVNGIAKESVTVKNASGNDENFQVSYMTFTIPHDKICQNNAIIALKDDRGDTIWSWHIWTTNDPSLLQPDIPIRNQTGLTYNLFPLYSLGWVDTNSYMDREDITLVLEQNSSGKTITLTVRQHEVRGLSNGCYYEFGRKDPFPRNQDDTPDGNGNFSIVQNNSATLGAAIRNPGTFYHQSGNALAWMSGTGYYNLWTGKYCDIAHVDEGTQLIKTIYDPSPKGYKIPASNAFTGFSRTNTEGPFKYGFNFRTGTGSEPSTVFFPASGYRDFSTGKVGGFGSQGFYWVSIPSGTDTGYQLGFASTRVEPKFSHARSYCYNVRPVEE